MAIRYDNITIKAELSKDGWIIDKPVITRSGIFTYHNGKGKVVKEYRPDEEVFKEDSLKTLLGIPITDGHKGILTTNSSLDGTIVGSVLSPGEREDDNVKANIVIHNVKRIGARRELSLGYQCQVDETSGEYKGEKYDCIQRDITYNHLAVVEKGRAGNARIRLDSNDFCSFPTEEDMVEVTTKMRFDNGLEYLAAPEVIVEHNSLKDKLKALQVKFDQVEAERDTAKSDLVTMKKDHDKAIEQERDSARSRVVLEEKAKQLALKFDGLSDRELKIAIAVKLGNTIEFKDRSDEYVNSAYDITVANEEAKSKITAKQKTTTTEKQDKSSGGSSSLDARARMIARIRGEKEAA